MLVPPGAERTSKGRLIGFADFFRIAVRPQPIQNDGD
jgi:hypothetical protein